MDLFKTTDGEKLGQIAIFVWALSTQILATALLPKTNGFTDAKWTVACSAVYLLSIWSISLLIKRGVGLNIVVPLIAATVPLASIAVAYLVYGQSVSLLKLGLLVGCCIVVGVASAIA